MLMAACLKRSYSCRRRTSSARGYSSPNSPAFGGRGSSMRDLISASVAAISRYSPASSSCRPCISSMYCVYWVVISAIGISRMSMFCRRIRYSSRSSGSSKASKNTSSACGGMYRSRGSCVSGSPLIIANGISACAGAGGGSGASALGLELTTFRSGLTTGIALRLLATQMHGAAHFIQGRAGHFARFIRALGKQIADQLRIVLKFLSPLAHRADLRDDLLDQRRLALQAADARRAAAGARPVARRLIRVNPVQVKDRAYVRIARVGAPHPRRISLHRLELARHTVRILAQADRVAVGLGHLAAVEPRHSRIGGQQRLWFGQDADAGTFQITEQSLPVRHGDARVALHQRAGTLQCRRVSGLLELPAQLTVQRDIAAAELLDCLFGFECEIARLFNYLYDEARDLAG